MNFNPGWRAKPLTLGYYISRRWREEEIRSMRRHKVGREVISIPGTNSMKPFRRASICLACALLLIASSSALAQVTSQTAQAAGPEKIAREFYLWYLHQLNKNSNEPLKQRTTALKYLTPQLYASVPRLERKLTADIFICAQDWNEEWEKNSGVDPVSIKGVSATTRITLSSGPTDKIRIRVTLKRTRSGWRIDSVSCTDQEDQ